MADVFISYHEKSAGELARQIADALESVGISCWYAKRDIPSGGDFSQYIPPQIDACKVFLLLLNENVYQSKHIQSETGLAFSRFNRGKKITILPLEIGAFQRKSWIEYYLIHIQSVKIPRLDEARKQWLTRLVAKILKRELPQAQSTQPESFTPSAKIVQRGECGGLLNVVTYALDEDGVLTISGKGPIRDFRWDRNKRNYGAPWWNKRKRISLVRIQNGVTWIGRGSFSGCVRLKGVEIPDSVTWIGKAAFSGCAELKSVEIPNSVKFIGDSTFENCAELASVNIPDGVRSIGDAAFENCARLASVEIPDSVTYIGQRAFCGCAGLASVSIPDSVTAIKRNAFSNCVKLTSVSIPDSVTSIGWAAFSGCKGLASVSIPDSVMSIEDFAFDGCTGLTSIAIPDSVATIKRGTFGSTGLESVNIPDSVSAIGDLAFFDCMKLASVKIPDSVSKVKSFTFLGCENLTHASVSAKTKIELGAFPDTTQVTRRKCRK